MEEEQLNLDTANWELGNTRQELDIDNETNSDSFETLRAPPLELNMSASPEVSVVRADTLSPGADLPQLNNITHNTKQLNNITTTDNTKKPNTKTQTTPSKKKIV